MHVVAAYAHSSLLCCRLLNPRPLWGVPPLCAASTARMLFPPNSSSNYLRSTMPCNYHPSVKLVQAHASSCKLVQARASSRKLLLFCEQPTAAELLLAWALFQLHAPPYLEKTSATEINMVRLSFSAMVQSNFANFKKQLRTMREQKQRALWLQWATEDAEEAAAAATVGQEASDERDECEPGSPANYDVVAEQQEALDHFARLRGSTVSQTRASSRKLAQARSSSR